MGAVHGRYWWLEVLHLGMQLINGNVGSMNLCDKSSCTTHQPLSDVRKSCNYRCDPVYSSKPLHSLEQTSFTLEELQLAVAQAADHRQLPLPEAA